MSDWRYWITYGGVFASESEDEGDLCAEAMDHHVARLADQRIIQAPMVEVEEVGEGE